MAMGYEGHVWSHGYDSIARQAKVLALLGGSEEWRQIATELGVRYVFWGREEKAELPESTQPWKGGRSGCSGRVGRNLRPGKQREFGTAALRTYCSLPSGWAARGQKLSIGQSFSLLLSLAKTRPDSGGGDLESDAQSALP